MVMICGWIVLPLCRMTKVNLLLCLLVSWQQGFIEGAANPGLQLAVTSKGLDYSMCVCVFHGLRSVLVTYLLQSRRLAYQC